MKTQNKIYRFLAPIGLTLLLMLGLISCKPATNEDAGITPLSVQSSEKSMRSFQFTSAKNSNLNEDIVAVIEGSQITATLPVSGDPTNLIATFIASDKSKVQVNSLAQESGVTAQDFSKAITYRVIAEDGSIADYEVTVTVASATAKELSAFRFLKTDNPGLAADVTGVISGTNISLNLPFGTTVTALVASFSTTGQKVQVGTTAQTSQSTANDFTNPVTYRVTAEDGTVQDYLVTVTLALASSKELTSFQFLATTNAQLSADVTGVIDQAKLKIQLNSHIRTNPTALIASFTTTGSNVQIAAAAQTSGSTANDFTSPITYTVTAADGSSQNYSVTVGLTLNPIPDTGQVTGYTATLGEDNDYNTSNQQSYTVNGDGTVTDNVTKLVWQQCSAGLSGAGCATGTGAIYTSANALTYCSGNTPGLPGTGWRLPTKTELAWIVDSEPAAGTTINAKTFPSTVAGTYWASTTYALNTANTWSVYFSNGMVNSLTQAASLYVRCVRGSAAPTPNLVDNGDQTITDTARSLTWDKRETTIMAWDAALTYCETSAHAGQTDWRLPNRNELASLVDNTITTTPLINAAFSNAVASFYWTSTTYAPNTANAWSVGFGNGNISNGGKAGNSYVRCVR